MKNKYLGVAAGCLGVLVVLGAGIWLWHGQHHNSQLGQQLDTARSAVADTGGAPSQNVPLNQTLTTPDASSGLSVGSSSPANGLGQTGGSQQSQSTPSSASSASGSAASSAFDPSTFAQYDKYKASTAALFGDVQKGTGTALAANHKAAVLYKGWLTNGQLFDESKVGSDGKYQPFVFTEGAHQVIPGWEQGLDGMKVGGVRLLIVPPSVGYGTTGQGSIPPNAVLIFQVQLLDVQ